MNLANVKLAHAALALVGIAGTSFVLGRLTAPKPAVHLVQDTASSSFEARKEEQHVSAGPVDVYRKRTVNGPTLPSRVAAASPGEVLCPVAEVIEEHEHRGPVVTDTHQVEQHAEATRTHLDLTVTPRAPPGWAVQVGIEDALGQRPVRAALRRRLFGPFWVEVSGVPARGQLGVAGAIEW